MVLRKIRFGKNLKEVTAETSYFPALYKARARQLRETYKLTRKPELECWWRPRADYTNEQTKREYESEGADLGYQKVEWVWHIER